VDAFYENGAVGRLNLGDGAGGLILANEGATAISTIDSFLCGLAQKVTPAGEVLVTNLVRKEFLAEGLYFPV
jgi:hypothetical protein